MWRRFLVIQGSPRSFYFLTPPGYYDLLCCHNTHTHTEQRPTTDLLLLALAPVFHNNTSTTTSATNVRTQSDLLSGWVVRAPLLGPLQALLCLHLITLLFLFKAVPPSIVLTHSLILFLDNLIVLSFIFTHALVVVHTNH